MMTIPQMISVWVLLMTAQLSFSQINRVVKLKNGSEIRGEVLPSQDNSIRLKTRDGSIWVFQNSEIDTIFRPRMDYVQSRFYNRTTIGGLAGEQAAFSAQTVNGYSFNGRINTGLGLGIEKYQWNRYLSLFGDVQYNILKRQNTPYLNLAGGLVKPFQKSEINKGGFFLSGSVGFIHYFTPNIGFTTSVGYRFSQLEYRSWWWEDFKTFHQYNQFEIRFGLTFK